ncbi:MAG: RluA family pseudouridine synthase [Pseudomonadota bacterium]
MPVTSTPYRPPPDTPLPIIYQDERLIIVDKPSGLLCVPGRGADKADCLEARLRRTHPAALTVHRLDMETSGLVVFALDADMQRALGRAFEARTVDKRYEAVGAGTPSDPSGTIDLPLAPDWPNRPLQKVDMRGKPAETRWSVLSADRHATRFALEPRTGRTHQLRVHLTAMGHPILGDSLYGHAESRIAAPRLLLHATQLNLKHPGTGKPIAARSPCPF